MKILQVVHGFPPRKLTGGTEIYSYHLSNELSRRHDVHVFYPIYEGRTCSLNNFEKNGLKIHELNLPYNFIEEVKKKAVFNPHPINKTVEKKFVQILNKVAPDIIHFQHLIGLSASLIEIAEEKEIPTVLTLHDYWFICPTIQLLKDDYSTCEGPDEQAENCFECWNERQSKLIANHLTKCFIPENFLKRLPKAALSTINKKEKFLKRKVYMKSLMLKVKKLIAPSKFLRNLFTEYGIPADMIVYSNNGYNLSVFKDFRKKKKKKLIFGFVGTVAKHKGVDVLIDAFSKVKNAELRIYGNYDLNSDYFKELSIKARKTNVKFIGGFKDIKQPYSEIDILIFPSIWYENCPLVLKEAMITNTPIIASNIGAIPEFVKEGKNGLLFEAGNPEDLYQKICTVTDNPKIVDELKKYTGHVRSIQGQTKDIENIYRRAIND